MHCWAKYARHLSRDDGGMLKSMTFDIQKQICTIATKILMICGAVHVLSWANLIALSALKKNLPVDLSLCSTCVFCSPPYMQLTVRAENLHIDHTSGKATDANKQLPLNIMHGQACLKTVSIWHRLIEMHTQQFFEFEHYDATCLTLLQLGTPAFRSTGQSGL